MTSMLLLFNLVCKQYHRMQFKSLADAYGFRTNQIKSHSTRRRVSNATRHRLSVKICVSILCIGKRICEMLSTPIWPPAETKATKHSIENCHNLMPKRPQKTNPNWTGLRQMKIREYTLRTAHVAQLTTAAISCSMYNLVGILWIVQRVQHEAAACFHSERRIHRRTPTTDRHYLYTRFARAHRDSETATHLRIGFSPCNVYPNYWFSRR